MQISLVYSGGAQNTNPDRSLGGFPSPTSINTNKNNLFDDVSPTETSQGKIDYRCLYIFNDDTDFSHQITIFVEYLKEPGATIEFGVIIQNAVQGINFSPAPPGGDFRISIQEFETDVITWNNDSTVLASNIQNALNSITQCSVSVVSQYNYRITFMGILGNKSLSTLSITHNTLGMTPTVSQVTVGSPINTVAPDTSIESVVPTGISFVSAEFPGVTIGTLNPSEGFPLWFKRTITAGFDPVEGDGFVLKTNTITTSLS